VDLPEDGEQAADQIIEKVVAFNQPAPFADDVTLVVVDQAS
jgi:serine phosphatase RsbU (regulator of sigma subunit)